MTEFSTGLSFEVVRLSIEGLDTYKKVEEFLKPKLTTSDKFGTGLLKFDGKTSVDNSMFLGTNQKLELQTLIFSGEKGLKELEIFRKDFLSVKANETMVPKIKASSVEVYFVSFPLDQIKTSNDLQQDFETNLGLQQNNIPKIKIEQGVYYIGGKTGAMSLAIQGSINAELGVANMVAFLKMKDKSALTFVPLLANSVDVSIETVLAFFIVNQLARTVMAGSIKNIHTLLLKSYPVGKVVTYSQVNEKSTTSSGKYLKRALSGVANKLSKPEYSNESKQLFLDWLTKFYNKQKEGKIKTELATFFKDIVTVLQ